MKKFIGILAVIALLLIVVGSGYFILTRSTNKNDASFAVISTSTVPSAPKAPPAYSSDEIAKQNAKYALSWKVGDTFDDFTLVSVKQSYYPQGTAAAGLISGVDAYFSGTTTVTGEYEVNTAERDETIFTMPAKEQEKFPHFPFFDNSGTGLTICFDNASDELVKMFGQKTGTATITVSTYHMGYWPKGEACRNQTHLISVVNK
jgi:hypothetical protein